MCPSLQNPAEPWYDFFKRLQKKECPFPAGHVEKFENENVGFAPSYIPYSLIGKYRARTSFEFHQKHGSVHIDCAMLHFEVMEV